MAAPKRGNVKLGPFPKGLNNVQKETSIPLDSLNVAINVDVNDDGKIERRKGYSKIYSGSDIHSFYADGDLAVFVEDGNLKQLLNDYSTNTLASGLYGPLSYLKLNNEIYYTSIYGNGIITLDGTRKEFGVDTPLVQPTLIASSGGGFSEGVYQVAITFEDDYGRESGTREARSIRVSQDQKISLINIPTSSTATKINVYCSAKDGSILYLQATVPMGVSNITLSEQISGKELSTQFMESPPFGEYIKYFKGTVVVASGNTLRFSEPWNYGLFHQATNYIEFPENIRFIETLNTGIYVAADKIYFIQGTNQEDFRIKDAYLCKAINNTAIKTETTLFNFENLFGECIYFWSDLGAMIGVEEGSVIPISHKRYIPDNYTSGSTYYRLDDGKHQLVTSLQKKTTENTMSIEDSASATVIRHGITL